MTGTTTWWRRLLTFDSPCAFIGVGIFISNGMDALRASEYGFGAFCLVVSLGFMLLGHSLREREHRERGADT